MKRSIWLAGGLVVVVVAGLMLWEQEPQAGGGRETSAGGGSQPMENLGEMDPEQLAAEQLAANRAVLEEIGEAPFEGPITERPAFVSHLEWQVLKNVAQQHPNPEQEMTRLVNHLRFAKQWDLWQETDPQDVTRHRALAEQLLEEIPSRVSNQELDPAYAQQMQQTLLTALIPDAGERRQRAAKEAARIGVQFRVEGGS